MVHWRRENPEKDRDESSPVSPVLLLPASAVPALPGPGAPTPAREITMGGCVEPVKHWEMIGTAVALLAAAGAALHPIEALQTV